MNKLTIEIPDGKRAKWVDGVLTLVDESGNRPITERIKTFEDACDALGKEHTLVTQCLLTESAYKGDPLTRDLIAYLKLRVIAAALNEGWTPKFTEDEYRWCPWFQLYTNEEIDGMDEDKTARVTLRSCDGAGADVGVAFADAIDGSTYGGTYIGSRIAFKSSELARYAGIQFTEIYADFLFG